jgi:hypothetical protein
VFLSAKGHFFLSAIEADNRQKNNSNGSQKYCSMARLQHHPLCAGWRHRAHPRHFQGDYIIMIA